MTIYHRASGRPVEIVGADLSGDGGWAVWWAYDLDGEEADLDDEFRGIKEDPLSQFNADGGVDEVLEEIASLPAGRVKGKKKAVTTP